MTGVGQPSVLVIEGSSEIELGVSRASATEVARGLAERFTRVAVMEFDRDSLRALESGGFDVVFPTVPAAMAGGPNLLELLDSLGVPYVGSRHVYDKARAKRIFGQQGLPIAEDVIVDTAADTVDARDILSELGGEVVVKPTNQGSSIGVGFAAGPSDLEAAVRAAGRFSREVIVERRLRGIEVSVGILEVERPQPFAPIEIRTPPGTWYDFEHRYRPGWSRHIVPATCGPELGARMQELAIAAFEALDYRDLSRVDFILEKDRPFLLEVNSRPAMTPTSLYPEGAMGLGIGFVSLLEKLVSRALWRN